MKFCQTSGGKRRHHHHPRSGQTNAGRQRPEPRRGAREPDVKPDLRQRERAKTATAGAADRRDRQSGDGYCAD